MRERAWILATLVFAGCGHSADEWKRQVRANEDLRTKLGAERAKAARAVAERTEAVSRVERLDHDLRELGVDPERLKATAEEQARAMEERARHKAQADAARRRLEVLRSKLAPRGPAITVVARGNLVTVQLAEAALFDKGKDTLRPDGKALVLDVAGVLRGDARLAARSYRVVGRAPGATRAQAALASSLARASEVLEVLAAPVARGGGGLNRERLLAAGAGEVDPSVGRAGAGCEIVVEPNSDELPELQAPPFAPY